MRALHAMWEPASGLALWGEVPGPPSGRQRVARQPQAPRPRVHPFAATVADLREGLARLIGALHADALATDLSAGEATIWLPSGPRGPVPSPFVPWHTERPDPAWAAPWTVPCLTVGAAAALDVLTCLPGRHDIHHPVDETFRFLADVAALALELVAVGRVIPALIGGESGWQARWRPAPVGADVGRLAALARRMPTAVRASHVRGRRSRPSNSSGHSQGHDPAMLLDDCLCVLVDTAVRDALGRTQLVPRTPRTPRTPSDGLCVEAWLAALSGADAAVAGEDEELALLNKTLEVWRRSGVPADGSYRMCLRLHPPDPYHMLADDDLPSDGEDAPSPLSDGWRIDFLLQARDDPSLLISAESVWRADETLDFVHRQLASPHEQLLGDLSRAARLYPPMARVMDESTPTVFACDVDEAADFLTEAAPLLEAAGFGVILPGSLHDASRLAARLRVRSPGAEEDDHESSGFFSIGSIVDFNWEVAAGGEVLSAEELEQLAAYKTPIVWWRGRWRHFDRSAIDRALALLRGADAAGQMQLTDALRIGLGGEDAGCDLPVDGVEADAIDGVSGRGDPLAALFGDADKQIVDVPQPPGFLGMLRPYQARGLSWLAFMDSVGLGACLADDMGLGKTIQVLALLVHERAQQQQPAPTLLVAPVSVVGNWKREAERFAPNLTVYVHHGLGRCRHDAFMNVVAGSDLVITTYSLAVRDRELLAGATWGRVVLDEAQQIKNAQTSQTRAIRSIGAHRRLALTGTPIENRLSELWSILDFLNPGLLGTAARFKTTIAMPIERWGDEQAAQRLRRMTQPFMMRRLKTDRSVIADLPEKIETVAYCSLSREQASLYQALVDDMMRRLSHAEGIERRGIIGAALIKLKQVCNHPAHLLGDGSPLPGRSGKLSCIETILDDVVAAGCKALVFTQFAEMGLLLQRHLEDRYGHDVPFLYGKVAKGVRDGMVTRFQSDSGPGIFVASLKAGGVGLNLTAANHVVHFDRWWNPAVEAQATDRAFRIGQRYNVMVRKLVCMGTIEEKINEMLVHKKDLADRVVGSGDAWLTELSTDMLRDLVKLSPSAIAEQ